MDKLRLFYTVLADKEGLPVKYFDWLSWKIVRLNGPYTNEEATQAITAIASQEYPGYEAYYLAPERFKKKAHSLAHTKGDKERVQKELQQKKGQQ